jgi:hypothetical protein
MVHALWEYSGSPSLTSSRRMQCKLHSSTGLPIERVGQSSPLPLNGGGSNIFGRLSRAAFTRFSSASRSNFGWFLLRVAAIQALYSVPRLGTITRHDRACSQNPAHSSS